MKGKSGVRKNQGKQPKAYWKWDPPSHRWYHPATWARLVAQGVLTGGALFFGHTWLGPVLANFFGEIQDMMEGPIDGADKYFDNITGKMYDSYEAMKRDPQHQRLNEEYTDSRTN